MKPFLLVYSLLSFAVFSSEAPAPDDKVQDIVSQQELDDYNMGMSILIEQFGPQLEEKISTNVTKSLDETIEKTRKSNIRLHDYNPPVFDILEKAPGYRLDEEGKLRLDFPLGEGWQFKLKVWIRIKKAFYRQTSDVTLEIKNLKISQPLTIYKDETGAYKIAAVHDIETSQDIDFDASGMTNLVVKIIDGNFKKKIAKAINEGAKKIEEHFIKMAINGQSPFEILGDDSGDDDDDDGDDDWGDDDEWE